MSKARASSHLGLVSAALALALAGSLTAVPPASAELRDRRDRVGDQWYYTDIRRTVVDNGEHRIWAVMKVDKLRKRGWLWLDLNRNGSGARVMVDRHGDVEIWRIRHWDEKRVPCPSGRAVWNRQRDVVAVTFRHGCLRLADREWFDFTFHLYNYVKDGRRRIPDETDRALMSHVEKG